MSIISGKLYEVNIFNWFIFADKQTAIKAKEAQCHPDLALAKEMARYWSYKTNSHVSFISPEETFLLLEQDGEYFKVLLSSGEFGWVHLRGNFEAEFKKYFLRAKN